jgi:UDPglucose--hexose-1-phosphate uridylyltransferase
LSQLRQDTLTGRWVIMATGRQGRPNEFSLAPPTPTDPAGCPFCPGHEDRTTPEITATGRGPRDGQSVWRVRVFSNMYPALEPAGPDAAPEFEADELFPASAALGGHEVVACTPDHQGSLGRLSADHLAELLMVVRDRAVALAREIPQVVHVLPFCNQGPQAGATLAHPHLQILAAPLVPALVSQKATNLESYHLSHGRCLLCDTVAAEEEDGSRLIAANDDWVLLAPWASSFPFEMRAIPRRHATGLEGAAEEELSALAEVLKSALERLEQIHQNPSYNVIIHTGASRGDGTCGGQAAAGPSFHWHLEVLPRLARMAGFEAGRGFAINSITPEAAAARLRGEG